MLQRLRSLQDAAATSRPTQLLPHLYVSGAVEAASLHILRHLGITHILNATEDLLLPDDSQNFMYAHASQHDKVYILCEQLNITSCSLCVQ